MISTGVGWTHQEGLQESCSELQWEEARTSSQPGPSKSLPPSLQDKEGADWQWLLEYLRTSQ